MDLGQLLQDLDARLSAAGASVTRHWRPGARRDDVEAALVSVGLSPPEDVVTWFGWHDGTGSAPIGQYSEFSQSPENVLLGGWYMLSVEQAVKVRQSSWELYREIEWHMIDEVGTWFPLLVFGGTPMLCVDCGGAPTDPAPVHILDPQGDDYSGAPRYPSLAHFVAAAIRLFDDGLTRPDPDRPGVVDVDRDRTPRASYW